MIRSSLLAISASALWLLLWIVAFAIPVGNGYGNYFEYADKHVGTLQCLQTNSVRIALYLILFAGVMYIAKWAFLRERSFGLPLLSTAYLAYCLRIAREGGRLRCDQPHSGRTVLKALALVLVWLLFWGIVSDGLYFFGASHFMGDCDSGDMECNCNNFAFLGPSFLFSASIGSIHVYAIALQRQRVAT
jgi:hypothetical protein